ncbi:MAG: efflux RND transporter periplasmic adaptor subunit [Saprospiraceae bacterium]
MRKIAALLLMVLILASCGGPAKTDEIPQDLEGKKAFLKEKKAAMRELKTTITQLEREIKKLDPKSAEIKETLVTTQDIIRKNFVRYVEIQGTVAAENTVKASSEIGGRLQGFTLEEGDYVKKGQVIGKVDVEQVRKSIAELQTRLKLAEDVYNRQKRLWDQNIGSEVQFLQAENNVESLKRSIETVQYQLTKEEIYSPGTGMVNMVFSKNGEVVGPGTPIFDILDLNKIKVVADVPEIYIQAVRRGEVVKMKFPALDMERTGKVSLLGSQINPNNRTFKVEVDLANPGKKLLPNLLTSMLIKDYYAPNAITLINELIQQDVSGRSYVFTVAEQNGKKTAKKVFVEIGESYDGVTEIKSGLTGSESVVVEGARGLVDSEPIKVN